MEKNAIKETKSGLGLKLKTIYKSSGGILIAFIILFVIMVFASPYFFSKQNMLNLARQTVTNGLLAFGLTCCLIVGVIDLSVGSMFSLASVSIVVLLLAGIPLLWAILITLLLGAVIGLTNGLLVVYTKIPAFIITLAMMSILRGCAYLLSGGRAVSISGDDAFEMISGGTVLQIPYPVIVLFVMTVILTILLKYTVFGSHMYATGGNVETALYSGINVTKVQIIVYIITGILAAMAGIMSASRVSQGSPTTGQGYEGDAIAAAVLGGTSFTGGRGSIPGTLVGALVLALVTNGLYMLDVSYYLQLVIQGILIIIAVFVDISKRNRSY